MLTKKYQSQETAIASYSWIELLESLGYVDFYALITENSTAENVLTTQTIQSNTVITAQAETVSKTYSSSTLGQPRIVGGDAYISGAVYKASTTVRIDVTIYKNSAATPISSTISTKTWQHAEHLADDFPWNLRIPLTETSFKVGDIIQVKIDFVVGANEARLAVSPSNSAGAFFDETNSQLKISIPFRIDV